MKKHIHFIGICGVAMSALAILYQKKGWRVTGSDTGFYPPISTHLTKNKIDFYPGWHPEKMGEPNLVVVGNVAGSQNPEFLKARELGLSILSYPELLARDLIKKNSLICAGTYGKTSTASLLTWILHNAGWRPAYMFGGLAVDFNLSADDEGGDWSVVEGDEYKTSRENPAAKFFSYRPTHLLLTAVSWDHLDIYPTEESFLMAFRQLIKMIPPHGLIVHSNTDSRIKELTQNAAAPIITYGQNHADYIYHNLQMDKNGLQFQITHNTETYTLQAPIIGEYMAENICGAFAMAEQIGINSADIIQAISQFNGIKRRLEKRGIINGATVYDDIAHSPVKARSVLQTLKKIHTGKIIAIFEPNTGNRQTNAADLYANAFVDADEIIIPRLTQIKQGEQKIIEGEELARIISTTHPQVLYLDDDNALVAHIKKTAAADGAIIFLGSHGFRGMIEAVISPLPQFPH